MAAKRQGIQFQLGLEVDELLLRQLLETNDAIFLGTGTQTSRNLQLSGQQLNTVTDALSYLQRVNRNADSTAMANKRVLVIGGGESAIDCARSAVRQGAAIVTVVYRGQQQVMRASDKEIQLALEEGVLIRTGLTPTRIPGKTKTTAACFTDSEGNQETISCDVVILAVGQVNRPPGWFDHFSIETDEQGAIRIDKNGKTSNATIYAGGDNTHGPDLVVTAIAAGRRAARGIVSSFHPVQTARKSIASLVRPEASKTDAKTVPTQCAP